MSDRILVTTLHRKNRIRKTAVIILVVAFFFTSLKTI
jgi:hypothetical protein